MDSKFIVSTIRNTAGTSSILMGNISLTGRYKRKVYTQVDSSNYSASTTWVLGPTFAAVSDFLPNSIVRLDYFFPMRNDSTGWGGCYIEPQVRFNEGSWQSLGSSGYDGVMKNGNAMISSYENAIFIDPAQTGRFSVQFRFYFRSYDSTVLLNGVHDINVISGTAPLMSNNNGLQHYAHIVVQEFATLA